MKQLIKAILWIGCYGGACWFWIKAKLGFNLLSQSQWRLLFDKSGHTTWPQDMAPKKLVCRILLAFIVIGILGLAVVVKKKKRRIPLVKGELPEKGNFRPSALASQGKIASSTGASFTPAIAPTTHQTSSVNVPPSSNHLMGDVIKRVTDIANTFEVSVFPHVKLENTFTQLVISDDATALLLKILPQTGKWQVAETSLPEESLWNLEGEQPKNVLKDILQSTATLARLEPEAHAIAVVIVSGVVQEAEKVKEYLEQNGILIACLPEDGKNVEGIPSWSELLEKFYSPKIKEIENASENM